MSFSNIERFDEIVGQAFARLYQSFPVPVTLQAKDFVGGDNVYVKADFNDVMTGKVADNTTTPDAEFCIACLKWLVVSGYVTANDAHYSHLPSAVLTAKGLEALKATPASLEMDTPIGERIVQAVKTEGRHGLRALVGHALGIGLQLVGR